MIVYNIEKKRMFSERWENEKWSLSIQGYARVHTMKRPLHLFSPGARKGNHSGFLEQMTNYWAYSCRDIYRKLTNLWKKKTPGTFPAPTSPSLPFPQLLPATLLHLSTHHITSWPIRRRQKPQTTPHSKVKLWECWVTHFGGFKSVPTSILFCLLG